MTPATSSDDRAAPRRAARAGPPLLISPDAADEACRALFQAGRWDGRVLAQPPDAACGPSESVAIGLYRAADLDGHRAFARWAQDAALIWIGVAIEPPRAVIGPISRPGRAGCGHCARVRMLAAAAGRDDVANDDDRAQSRRHVAALAGSILAEELDLLGAEGVLASRLLDHVLIVDAASGRTSAHRFVPVPGCPVCGGPSTTAAAGDGPRLSPQDAPEDLLAALGGWLDRWTGVVPAMVVDAAVEASLGLPVVVTAAPPHVVGHDGSLTELPVGWGKGFTLSGAILSAVGESIERYSASLPDPSKVVWAPPGALPGDVMMPASPWYSEDQYRRPGFPYVRFDPSVSHPWVEGRWLGSAGPVWVPAVLVFLALGVRPEHVVVQGTSNGLAASGSLDDAALRATLELVERDAFLAAWLTGRPGRRVDAEAALDDDLLGVVRGVEAFGAAVEVYLLSTSAIGATALCLSFGDGDRWPGVTIGIGADLDPRSAVRQAVLELGQTGPHLRRLMRGGAIPVPGDATGVRGMLDHAAYYFPAARASAFDRLRTDESPITRLEGPRSGSDRSLASCATALTAAHVRVAVVDVTSVDVATGPFRVARAVSPDLQPLSYGYGLEIGPVSRVRALGLADDVPPVHPVW